MRLTKLRTVVAALVVLGVLGAGAAGLVYHSQAGEPGKPGGGPAAAAPDADGPENVIRVPSRVDGVLVLVGTEIKEGEKVPPGRLVTVKIGGEEKKYRRLRVGDKVEEGQLLASLDDRVPRDELAIKSMQVKAAKAEQQAAMKTRDEAEQRYKTMERLYNNSVSHTVSMEDLHGAKLTWDRYSFEEVSKRALVGMAEAEEKLAETHLGLYEIRSPASGVLTKIARHAGEGVRAYETVFQILTAPEHDD